MSSSLAFDSWIWTRHVCLFIAGLNLPWASLRAAEDRVYYEVDDYPDVEKIDAHFHIRTSLQKLPRRAFAF